MLALRNVTQNDAPLIRSWMRDDHEGKRRLSFYANPLKWIMEIDSISRYGYIVLKDKDPMGFVDLERKHQVGYLAFYIAPIFRNLGLGKKLLPAMETEIRKLCISRLVACVENDNARSKEILRLQEYVLIGTDKDGLLVYQKIL